MTHLPPAKILMMTNKQPAGVPMQYAHLAAEIFEQPLMIHAPALQASLAYLSGRGMNLQLPPIEAASYSREQQLRAGYESVKGVGIINVFGKMVHRGSGMDAISGLVSYDMLSVSLQQALDDDDVHEIAMLYNSPGGVGHGLFDFVDQIHAARQIKPITAIVSDVAASAAYACASAADEIVVTRTSITGSVGVVWAHMDNSGALEQAGRVVTYVHAGQRKIDGAPTHPLSDAARASMQAQIDEAYGLFVDTVARNRGLSTDAVRATEAAVYQGGAAIPIGLADRVSSEGAALSRLFAQASSGAGSRHLITANPLGGAAMSELDQTHSGGEPKKATADITPQLEAAKAEGHAAGAAAERDRITAVLSCEAAADKPALAKQLALTDGITAEAAAGILAAAQPEGVSALSGFEAAMEAEGNADVGADGEQVDMTAAAQSEALWGGFLAEKKTA